MVYIKVVPPSHAHSLALRRLFCSFLFSLFLSLGLPRFSILCVLFALYVSDAFLLGCFLIYVESCICLCTLTHTHTLHIFPISFLHWSCVLLIFLYYFFTVAHSMCGVCVPRCAYGGNNKFVILQLRSGLKSRVHMENMDEVVL